ncbi:hypothetical protein D0Z07_6906 [Hyphodiscus hymeniophilus]|uniref:Uncharacterized protein n=1 Tax=Hyphodiscus hymeniophilus TaxID=353542 RepID=A0A9P6VG29_9HELO|nr:hypothetical protein D0Z07_6906 [Hyphodiscus hymeniophilus]
MKFSKTFEVAAFLGLANAQNIPSHVTILSPRPGAEVGVNGLGWLIDVVAEFTPPPATSSATPASSSANPDDGFIPFLNSVNLTTFAPGPDPGAPGFVCIVNGSTTNFAGVFELNAITNSDAQGNILEAYFTWYVPAAALGSNVNITSSVFFLNSTAGTTYTKDPATDPAVISNVATVSFFIFGDAASNVTAPATTATPVSIDVFTPRGGEVVGVNGAGWMVDLVLVNTDLNANVFAPINGYSPLYHDNFTDPKFAPGPSPAVPGLVVLSNTSTLAGGATTNLANLFQINAVTGVVNGVISEYWCTWLVGAAFAGKGQPSSLTIFLVNGTAPATINGSLPTNIISDVIIQNFTLSGSPVTPATNASGSGNASGPGAITPPTTSGTVGLFIGTGSILLGALALLF